MIRFRELEELESNYPSIIEKDLPSGIRYLIQDYKEGDRFFESHSSDCIFLYDSFEENIMIAERFVKAKHSKLSWILAHLKVASQLNTDKDEEGIYTSVTFDAEYIDIIQCIDKFFQAFNPKYDNTVNKAIDGDEGQPTSSSPIQFTHLDTPTTKGGSSNV